MEINDDRLCNNCSRPRHAHLLGNVCPGNLLSVSIDYVTLERCARSGHPRLLAALLAGRQERAFADVRISTLRVVCATHTIFSATVPEHSPIAPNNSAV